MLQAFDSYTVFEASRSAPGALMHDLVWGPVIDGVEILDDPRKLAAAGKFNKVPVLLGTNMDEGTLFVKASHDLNVTGMYEFVSELFGEETGSLVMQQVRWQRVWLMQSRHPPPDVVLCRGVCSTRCRTTRRTTRKTLRGGR